MNLLDISDQLDASANWQIFSSPAPKLVIFDCDDVLVEQESATLSVIVDFAHENGLPDLTTEQAKLEFAGRSLTQIVEQIGHDASRVFPPDTAPKLRDAVADLLGKSAVPVVGAEAMLKTLASAQIPFRIVSNSSCKEMMAKCLRSGLGSVICAGRIHSAPDMDRPRVDPQVYLTAAAKEGVQPSEVVTVEESVAGIQAALNAQMRCILLTENFDTETLNQIDWNTLGGRVMAVSSFKQLTDLLAKLFNVSQDFETAYTDHTDSLVSHAVG